MKRALTLLSLTLLLAAVGMLSTDRSSAKPDSDESQDTEPMIVKNKRGAAISVIGRYDVGLNKESSRDRRRVSDAVSSFVLKDRSLFGLSGNDNTRFVARSVDALDNTTVVAQIDQFVGELRVLDSDLTAVFEDDGALQSVNGGIVANSSPNARPSLSLRRVQDILRSDARAREMGDLNDFQPMGENAWQRKDGATIEAGWSRQFNTAVWKAFLPHEIIWIADSNGAILRRQSQRDEGPTRGCNVRHRDWPRTSTGRATSIAEASSGTMTSRITCEADESFGTCKWLLKREPFGFPHGIARVQDENGGEAEDEQACSSNSVPSFTAGNGDALREQGAFYIANQMRFFIKQNVWDRVSPNRDANVDIHMDDAGAPTAFFNDFFTDIHCNPTVGQQEVVMHEYGHYVVWTYDDVSNNCDQGNDEGNAIDETLGNVFAGLYARDSREVNARYGAYSGIVGAPAPHTNAASLLLLDVDCQSGDGIHNQAQAFEQAVWELLFNRDCTIDTCSAGTGNGSRIWGTADRDDAARHVGAALGFALKALGQNITHQQIAAQMIQKIKNDSGTTAKNRAKAVFVHHGVL